MPKTTTAKRTFKIVDLIRQRSSFQYIEVPKFPVEVVIEVTTTGLLTTPEPASSAVFDRLEGVARDKLEEYEKIITEELGALRPKSANSSSNPNRRRQRKWLKRPLPA